MNHVLTHVCLAMESVQFRATLSDQFAVSCCLVSLGKEADSLEKGQASSGAFRIILSLRDVVTTLNDSLNNTIPQLVRDMPINPTDKTRTSMDVVKLDLAKLPAWLMRGDGYVLFRNRFENDLWFIQAIEINTPKLKTDSLRYQFQSSLIDTWPSRLQLFIDGLRQIAREGFARKKFGYIPDVPFDIRCSDDMPVVVRDQSVIKTYLFVVLFPKHDPITHKCFACSNLSIIRSGRNAPLPQIKRNGRNNWVGRGSVIIISVPVPAQLEALHLDGRNQPGTRLPTGIGHITTELRV